MSNAAENLLSAFGTLIKAPSLQTKQDFDQAYSAYQAHRADHTDDEATATMAFRVDAIARELGRDNMLPRDRLAHDTRNMHLRDADEHNKREDELRDLLPRERLAVLTQDMWRR